MFARILVVTAFVLAAPLAALASSDAKATGGAMAPTGNVSHPAHSEAGTCPGGETAKADGTCSHSREKASVTHGKSEAAHGAHKGAHDARRAADHGAQGARNVVPGKVTVAELVTKLAATPAVMVFDVNNEQVRTKEGMIPGAKLLTSASKYDPDMELGADKDAEMVFYCANTRCTASHTAAVRAIEAGYTKVSILPEGIAGWKAAGNATSAVPRS